MTRSRKKRTRNSALWAAAEAARDRALRAQMKVAIVDARIRELESAQARRLTRDIMAAAKAVAPHDQAGQFRFAEQLLKDPELLEIASRSCLH